MKFDVQEKARVVSGLIGKNISYTLSPVIHEAAGRALGLDLYYFPLNVLERELKDSLKFLQFSDFTGCNVTIPHKENVLNYVNETTDTVKILGAANTLIFKEGRIYGDNTDWKGFITSWQEEELGEVKRGKAVILGAGGAASAIIYALIKSGVREVLIFNRTLERAESLASHFNTLLQNKKIKINAKAMEDTASLETSLRKFDILINCTPVGTSPNTNDMPIDLPERINPELRCYDLIYNPGESRLVRELKSRGIKASGGLGMLVHQAALSFEMWTGVKPDTGVMFRAAESFLREGGSEAVIRMM